MNTQEDNQISNMDSTSEQLLSVGKTLFEAREQLGLSVNDVANRIKFAPRQIEALEADDYTQLPEAAFVRGFVRSYARLLELDPARLLSSLPSSHVQTSSTHEMKSVDIPLPSAFSARRHNIIWLAAALVIAVSLAIFERMHSRAPEKAAEQAETVAQTQTTVQTIELPTGTAEGQAEQVSEQAKPVAPVAAQAVRTVPVAPPVPQQAARPAPATAPVLQKPEQPKIVRAAPVVTPAPVAVPKPAAAAAPAPAPAVVAPLAPPKAVRTTPAAQAWSPVPQRSERVVTVPAPAVAAATTAAPEQPKVNGAANTTEHALRIEFDEDAWVEVKDSSDKALVSRMHTAGSLVRVTGKGPLLVIIGNARAVRLFDNGKQINLERYTTAEVARVKLK